MRRLLLGIILGGSITAAHAVVGPPVYRPGGSSGEGQFKDGAVFGGSPDVFFSTITNSLTQFKPPRGTSTPSTDCDSDSEKGRIWVDTGTATSQFYICNGATGWSIISGSGGGASTLAVDGSDVQVTSPTASIDFSTQVFTVTASPATEANIGINVSSVTLLGPSIDVSEVPDLSGTYLTTSSATATYLQQSSAVVTYVQLSSITAVYLQKSSATSSYVANGAGAGGDLSGTYPSPSVTDDSHAHTGSTLSGIDISDDTNLAATAPLSLTGDTLSLSSNLPGGSTSYIQNTNSLQTNTTFYVTSGTITGKLTLYGDLISKTLTSNFRLGEFALMVATNTSDFNHCVGNNACRSLSGGIGSNYVSGLNGLRDLQSDGYQNTVAGNNVLPVLQHGAVNSGGGYGALGTLTDGDANTVWGAYGLGSLTWGDFNGTFNYQSLYNLLTGSGNNARGHQSGYAVTTSTNCIWDGHQAGYTLPTTCEESYYYGHDSGSLSAAAFNQFSLGRGSRSENRTANFGGNDYPFMDFYAGSGIFDTTPSSVTYHATNASGTNVAGGDLSIAGGRGTGTASGGIVRIQVSTAGVSGSSNNPLMNVLTAGATMTAFVDLHVPDEAYDASGWDGDLSAPTKNSVRDKVESLSLGGGGASALAVANAGVLISTPTVGIDFDARFNGDLQGSATASIQIASNSLTTDHLAADSVSSSELNATGVEAELEAVIDLNELQGQISDTQIADGAVDGGTGGEIADGSVTAADLAADSVDESELLESMNFTSSSGDWNFGAATELSIPVSAAPVFSSTGGISIDSSITGFFPLITYSTSNYSDATTAVAWYVVSVASDQIHTAANGDVPTYDSATSRFVLSPAGGGSTERNAYFSAAAGLCQLILGCGEPEQYETATTSTSYIAATFTSGTTYYWQTSFTLPDDYEDGTTFTAVVEWTSTATTTSATWNVDMKAVGDDDTLDGSWGTAVTIGDATTAAGDLMRTVESGAITAAGSPVSGDRLFLRVYRGNNGDARFAGIFLTYQLD